MNTPGDRWLEKYLRICRFEASQGYQNKAVMGGLQNLLAVWLQDAQTAQVPPASQELIRSTLTQYPRSTPAQRRAALSQLFSMLDPASTEVWPSADGEMGAWDLPPVQKKLDFSTPKAQKPDESKAKEVGKPRQTRAKPTPEPISGVGLDAPVGVIRGVGEKQAANLNKLGIYRIRHLLTHFPRRYDDYSKLKSVAAIRYGEEVTVAAYVQQARLIPTRRGKRLIEAIVSDNTGSLRLLWFNQEFQLRYLKKGMLLSISGRVETYMGRPVMFHPDYEAIERQQLNTNRIVPVYPLTALVTQRWLRRTLYNTLNYWVEKVPEFLPEMVMDEADLIGEQEALRQIHFPDSFEALATAQRRLAFDELFLIQLGVIGQKRQWQSLDSEAYTVTDDWLARLQELLPYQLTNAQQAAVKDIRADLAKPQPMNRLLQGDVGSGKTAVALLGLSIVMESGAQTALMAPTSILAEQHYRTLKELLATLGEGWLEPDAVCLLTGDTSAAERKLIHAKLLDGSAKLLVGTHALIEDQVAFKNLQMVVVDEQHRFGVEQRAALRKKGHNPHLLVMTATPIPRSLQLTLYGDLDVSVMDEMPLGRLPVKTSILFPSERESAYKLIRSEVAEGNQAFIIYPLVEEGENEEAKAAVAEHKRLSSKIFPDLRVGLVHGRLKPAEKDKVMLAFKNQEYDVLVSTSVIEVGVDIPNATVMVVEGADRFGLAQLHQFRGRVGRGKAQAYCVLIPEQDFAVDNARLKVMTETNDGFLLAEKDLEQRGPGDFFGTRQAGNIDLKMASLADTRLISQARKIAERLYDRDPNLEDPQHQALKVALHQFWPEALPKGDLS